MRTSVLIELRHVDGREAYFKAFCGIIVNGTNYEVLERAPGPAGGSRNKSGKSPFYTPAVQLCKAKNHEPARLPRIFSRCVSRAGGKQALHAPLPNTASRTPSHFFTCQKP